MTEPARHSKKMASIFFNVYFICLERARKSVSRGRGRERERISSRLCAVGAEPSEGFNLTNREIMT